MGDRLRRSVSRFPPLPRVIAQSLLLWLEEALVMFLMNPIWLLCCLTIVLGPPATIGMYYVADRAAHDFAVRFRDMYEGGRRYFGQSWLLAALNLVVIVVVYFDLRFFQQFDTPWSIAIQVFFTVTAIFWLITLFYAFPFLLRLEQPRVDLALRNGLFAFLASPIYTLVIVGLAAGLVVLIFRVAILILLFPSLIVLLGTHATMDRIAHFKARHAEYTAKAEGEQRPRRWQRPDDDQP